MQGEEGNVTVVRALQQDAQAVPLLWLQGPSPAASAVTPAVEEEVQLECHS